MTALDLPDIGLIADAVHPGFPEELSVLAEKQRLHPDGARLLEVNGRAAGYLFSHPWIADDIPPLNTRLGALPARPDIYYLHDLALLPEARGTGAAPMVVDAIVRHARALGFAKMALVAVNGSQAFWRRQGFAARRLTKLLPKLRAYEDDARYMVRTLRAP